MTPYPWQETQWQQLSRAKSLGRLSHAYLLTGMMGLGKTDFARAFAAELLCEHRDKARQLMRANTHPDFIEIVPHEKGHVIKIEQIRQLTQQLTQKSQYGGYQVVLLSPAEAMPVGAANALLKTLEEPLGEVVIFLVTHCEDQLPATIISRCQKIHFYAQAETKTLAWLQEQINTKRDVTALLSMAGGAPLMVKRLVDGDYVSLRNSVLAHLLSILTASVNPIKPAADWLKQDKELVFYAFYTLAMDIARVQMGVCDGVMNGDSISLLEKIATCLSPLQLQQWIMVLLEKKQLTARGVNLNEQLLFEDLLLRFGSVRVN